MRRIMGIVGILALILFIVFFGPPDAPGKAPGFEESFFGMAIILITVLGGVVPWLYLLEISHGRVSESRWWFYCVGTWVVAPFVLLAAKPNNEISNAP